MAIVDKCSVSICRPLLMPMKVERRGPVKDEVEAGPFSGRSITQLTTI